MSNDINWTNPKYILAIDHTDDYKNGKGGFSYHALKSTKEAHAFAEGAVKATKAESVYCWHILIRKGNGTKFGAEYKTIGRFYKDGMFDSVADDPCGNDFGFLGCLDVR